MYQRILLPVDLNETSHLALPQALHLARHYAASLHVLTVVPDFGMVSPYLPGNADERIMAGAREALARFVAEHLADGVPVAHSVARGTVYEVIVETANAIGADLIVIGAHRPGQTAYHLGTNAGRVVRHASQSVLVVR